MPVGTEPGSYRPSRLTMARPAACKAACLVTCTQPARLVPDGVWLLVCAPRFKKEMQGSVFGCLHRTSCTYLLHEVVTLPPTSSVAGFLQAMLTLSGHQPPN
jgi:hypothetical protein